MTTFYFSVLDSYANTIFSGTAKSLPRSSQFQFDFIRNGEVTYSFRSTLGGFVLYLQSQGYCVSFQPKKFFFLTSK